MEEQNELEKINDGYAICFNQWALDKDIKNELGLLLIISSLSAEKGYCWASNKYLGDLFEIDEYMVSKKIKKLENKGYLKIEYEKNGAKITKRILRLSKMTTVYCQKRQPSIVKNDKEKNTNIKNTNNNIYNIVEYLNQKANVHYKPTTKKTRSLINARLDEGFTEEDFYKVIDNKCKDWLNTKMSEYLRPETLFGTKFESYLNKKKFKSYSEELEEEFRKEGLI